MTNERAAPAATSPLRGSAATSPTRLVLLMAASLFINYIDRGNLATAGAQIRDDLQLSATAFGALLGAFYFVYAFSQLPSGWLADRYGAKVVLGLGAALWSAATLLTGFASGFVMLFALRLLLGLGESAAFTTTSKLIASNVPRERIGIANGVIGFGYMVGPAVGTLIGGLLMARFGWRPVFIVFGAVSFIWLLPWSRAKVIEPRAGPGAAVPEGTPPLRAILRQRALWGAAMGHFAGNYNWYFVLGYLPMYLEKARGFSKDDMSWVVSSVYLVNAAAALFAGWAIDRWIRAGRSATVAYKVPMGLAHVAGLACMLAIPTLPIGACIACLFIYEIFLGFSSPGYFGIPQVLAGPRAAARWVGVQNMIGNLPGIIGVVFAGVLIDASGGSYETAFTIAGAVNVLGLIGWLAILPRIKPIRWAEQASAG